MGNNNLPVLKEKSYTFDYTIISKTQIMNKVTKEVKNIEDSERYSGLLIVDIKEEILEILNKCKNPKIYKLLEALELPYDSCKYAIRCEFGESYSTLLDENDLQETLELLVIASNYIGGEV